MYVRIRVGYQNVFACIYAMVQPGADVVSRNATEVIRAREEMELSSASRSKI